MTDLDGRFNLNNLASPNSAQWKVKFERLLQALQLDTNLSQNVIAWMGNGSGSASEAWYLGQAVPYRPALRQFAHVSELRLVQGFDSTTYARILPHVSALPPGTTININTATVPVLMTLDANLTEQTAAAIWQEGHATFSDVSELASPPYNIIVPAGASPMYGTKSQFFLAHGDIALDGLSFTFYSLLQRNLGHGPTSAGGIVVLQRWRGGE